MGTLVMLLQQQHDHRLVFEARTLLHYYFISAYTTLRHKRAQLCCF